MATKKKKTTTRKKVDMRARTASWHPSIRARVIAACHDCTTQSGVTRVMKELGIHGEIASNTIIIWVHHWQETGKLTTGRKITKFRRTPAKVAKALSGVDMSVLDRKPTTASPSEDHEEPTTQKRRKPHYKPHPKDLLDFSASIDILSKLFDLDPFEITKAIVEYKEQQS